MPDSHAWWNTKPDKEMLEFDESSLNIRLYKGIGLLIKQFIGTDEPNKVKGQPQEEREPTR